jgi:hypothetical protein
VNPATPARRREEPETIVRLTERRADNGDRYHERTPRSWMYWSTGGRRFRVAPCETSFNTLIATRSRATFFLAANFWTKCPEIGVEAFLLRRSNASYRRSVSVPQNMISRHFNARSPPTSDCPLKLSRLAPLKHTCAKIDREGFSNHSESATMNAFQGGAHAVLKDDDRI